MRKYNLNERLYKFIQLLKSYNIKIKKKTPFEILISALLSQRTKDELTDKITKKLFSKYKAPEDFINLSEEQIAYLIKPVGFYRIKAKRIKEIANILVNKFNSNVPKDFDILLSLPGIGRKTANCVLAYGFNIPALPVDTHVHRIVNRIGFVNTNTEYATENELKKIIAKNYWQWISIAIIKFGKSICTPIKPKCNICKIKDICKYNNK